jgi:hypothetical protein|tara:strand:+ start:114 stop:503 length:390 start_codon:yes stop_codon:yes gene_type:complete
MLKSKSVIWKKFSRLIRKESANHQGMVKCISCNRVCVWEETDCGHFFENTERSSGWGGNALWYDLRNFGAQCQKCNRFASPEAKQDWSARFVAEHGIEVYNEMKHLRDVPKKWTPEEVNKILDDNFSQN